MDKTALITGGTSGIGKAISQQLEKAGFKIIFLTRDIADFENPEQLIKQVEDINKKHPIDLLVHSAGVLIKRSVLDSSISDYDYQHNINLKAPIIITKILLNNLIKNQGQIVFINSLAVNHPKKDTSFYASTKAGLKAFADNLRTEINEHGVRVISIYPGATATPLTQKLTKLKGKSYNPQLLIQPGDISQMVLAALKLPLSAEVTDIYIRPFRK